MSWLTPGGDDSPGELETLPPYTGGEEEPGGARGSWDTLLKLTGGTRTS